MQFQSIQSWSTQTVQRSYPVIKVTFSHIQKLTPIHKQTHTLTHYNNHSNDGNNNNIYKTTPTTTSSTITTSQ